MHIKYIFLFFVFIQSCQNKDNCYIYVSNASSYSKNVGLAIYLDGKLVINKNFKYSEVSNDYYNYVFSLEKGKHKIEVKSINDSIIKSKIFLLEKKKYITITRVFSSINNYKQLAPVLKDSITTLYELRLDSLEYKKDLFIDIRDEDFKGLY